jgi:hypothetical protein
MSCPEDDTVLGTCAINRRLPSRTLTCGRLEDDTVQERYRTKLESDVFPVNMPCISWQSCAVDSVQVSI